MGWGDEVMVTGRVRVAQAADPRKVRIAYERPRWHEAWDHNPRIARPEEKGEFQILNGREGGLRPYAASKSDKRWTWKAHRPPRGELYFSDVERRFGEQHAGMVVLEPGIKSGASPNKQWGRQRWKALAEALAKANVRIAQVGASMPAELLAQAQFVWTPSMRQAAAVIAHSAAVVVHEGGLHHVAAAVGTPAVVLYGGYISPEVTGYAGQASLFRRTQEHPLGCGWRVECQHCKDAMNSITVEEVMSALQSQTLAKAA